MADPFKYDQDELFARHPKNPILTKDDWPYCVNSVFNPGAAVLEDGTTLLLCRCEDRRGHSHLTAARSADGVSDWSVDPEPTILPDPENYPEELWGIEDPRITFVPELGAYAILYTAYSRGGPCVSLALTNDFKTFDRFGDIFPPDDKDAALLPHRVGDFWTMFHRPQSPLGAHIWVSYSPDLRHWGSHKMILRARRGGWWDARRIGLAGPPIETPRGWLVMYHGVRETPGGCIYRMGLALFDLLTPERCLLRGDTWVFGPEADYERHGDVENVVFPCGHAIAPDGDTLRIYYGAADSTIAVATASLQTLLDWLDEHGCPAEEGTENG